MHLVLTFASGRSEAAQAALRLLDSRPLPHLRRLLGALTPIARDPGDPFSLSAPHERLLARSLGWPPDDGLIPLARLWAWQDGLDLSAQAPDAAWGLLQLTHWHLGTEQVSHTDPQALSITPDESRALHDALLPLLDEGGWRLRRAGDGPRDRWYLGHPLLAALPTASPDRVAGRNVDLWLDAPASARPALRALRRLQAEVQMLLHAHPVNQAREARGQPALNSFWLSGTGDPALPLPSDPASLPILLETLRPPALAEDGAAWLDAWDALDRSLADTWTQALELALEAPAHGAPQASALRLSLCGEAGSITLGPRPRAWWQRGPLAPWRAGARTPLLPWLAEL
ncbi:hypothetical protein [Ideonella livida]|uniref:Phosphoglycerate mutase n=1 Tax=Ideonella livida TaxID=2707176 RepID=A0A7C9TH27_9BURK|nr:hypothetical protein [Ideonella livida]NDY90098.1 hypothetical protein [Ideonella livida]